MLVYILLLVSVGIIAALIVYVLYLRDQVYDLRRQLRRVCDALAAQPPEVQAVIRRALPPLAGLAARMMPG